MTWSSGWSCAATAAACSPTAPRAAPTSCCAALTQERGGIVIDAELGARVRGGERQIRGWTVPIPGQHNALNALAAIAVGDRSRHRRQRHPRGLGTFTGVKRRFELTGDWNGASIYDDYAHHPAEISAVLAAARAGARGRVIAVFEPHRYSRVHDLFGDFCACFSEADNVIVAPLYSAGEQPLAGHRPALHGRRHPQDGPSVGHGGRQCPRAAGRCCAA